ncbi:MAG: uroporphyrinogen-III synthase, partial [Mariprofundus sp.]
PASDASKVTHMLQQGEIDAVLLGSAKVARFYLHRIGSLALANKPVLAVISEQLAVDARELGLNVQIVAKHASFDAMLDALVEYFEA